MEELLNFHIGSLTLEKVLVAVLIVLVGIIVSKIAVRIFKKILSKSTWDDNLQSVMVIIARFVAYALVVLIALDFLGIPMSSVLTVLSIVGLAVSLAIQDTLANVFSGMLLLAAKTFSSGDYVELNGLEGTVINVDLMNTHLRTADNKTVRIPNSDVQTSPIVNYSHEPTRRVELRVIVSYQNDTEAVKAALLRAANETEAVIDDPAPFAGLFAYKNNGIQYVLQAWTDSSTYWKAYYGMTENVRRVFQEDGIKMTYLHVNVHTDDNQKEL